MRSITRECGGRENWNPEVTHAFGTGAGAQSRGCRGIAKVLPLSFSRDCTFALIDGEFLNCDATAALIGLSSAKRYDEKRRLIVRRERAGERGRARACR